MAGVSVFLAASLSIAACSDGKEAPPEPVAASAISASAHESVATLIQVSWTQEADAEAWVEFSFGDGELGASPPTARSAGENSEWVLGVPSQTEVSVTVHTDSGGALWSSDPIGAVTGALPEDLLEPAIDAWDPALASGEGWLLGSVDIDGGSSYSGPWWLFIADRKGRIVWYRELEYWQSMFPRVARDGTHLAYDQQYLLDPDGQLSSLVRTTLDGTWTEETPMPGLGWCWDETGDGTVFYDQNKGVDAVTIQEISPDGSQRTVWDCTAWQAPLDPDREHCFTNTVNWVEQTDTILWSTYWGDYALEVDRDSGEVLWYAGNLEGGWSFDPPDAVFDLQHYPNYTPDGTLLVSTHVPELEGEQRAREYEVDYQTRTLRQVWVYGEGVDQWAKYSGEAVRLDNGNTLINYGTGGGVREVTPEGETVWLMNFGDERTLGHTQLIGDLYAVNAGP